MRDADFGYTDPHGTEVLRLALRDYLGRVRGVVTDADRVVVTSGYCQGRTLVCHALAATGTRRVAVEDPCHAEVRISAAGAGLELVPVPVDGEGIRVDALERAAVSAVFVTPAHQYPTGAVLSGARRGALLDWLRRREAFAIEDDYDAEYRYDRAPIGALQAMDPERMVYAGTASKTLAPAMRLGWLVVPPRLLEAVRRQQRLADFGVSRIEQHAFADFLSRGELDRHLRRMRVRYRARRDALVEALVDALPEARVHGIRAGLHVTVQLLQDDRGRAIRDEGARRGLALTAMSEYYLDPEKDSSILLLGYGRSSEAVIRAGVRELAAAVRAVRAAAERNQPSPGTPQSLAVTGSRTSLADRQRTRARKSGRSSPSLGSDPRLAGRRALQLGDVELHHLQHRLADPLRLFPIRVRHERGKHLGHDLPGEPISILEPAALFGRSSLEQGIPVAVDLLLGVAAHDE